MFQIENGRQEFWQWDINQRIIVEDETITEIHYCNKTDNCSLVTEVYSENGINYSNVPNILLQTNWNINVYGWDTNHTKHYKCFKVKARSKPADYVYTETDIFSVEELVEEATEGIAEEVLEILPISTEEGVFSLKQNAWEEEAANTASGKGAVALGGYNKALAKCSMAVNYDNEVKAEKAFVCGSHNKATEAAEGAFVAGHGNTANSTYQTILGSYGVVWESDSLVVGNGSSESKRGNAFKVTKEGDVEAQRFNAYIGINTRDATVNNNLNVLYNIDCNTLKAHAGATFGSGAISKRHDSYGENIITGAGSSAFGGNNKVFGGVSTAIGTSNTIPEGLTQVFIAGHMCEGATSRQAVFGSYSNATAEDMLVVGNGNSAKRKNALEVKRNGNLVIGGNTLTIGSTTITEEQLKKLLQLI